MSKWPFTCLQLILLDWRQLQSPKDDGLRGEKEWKKRQKHEKSWSEHSAHVNSLYRRDPQLTDRERKQTARIRQMSSQKKGSPAVAKRWLDSPSNNQLTFNYRIFPTMEILLSVFTLCCWWKNSAFTHWQEDTQNKIKRKINFERLGMLADLF